MKKAVQVQDRRIQKTRSILYQALIKLVTSKGYDAIIVQDILDLANVGRSTFYAHFRDKDELLISGIRELKKHLSSVPDIGSYPDIGALSGKLFDHALEFRPVYKALLASQARSIVNNHFQEMLAEVIMASMKAKGRSLKNSVPVDLLASCLASIIMTIMIWWMNQKPKMAASEIDNIFKALVAPILNKVS